MLRIVSITLFSAFIASCNLLDTDDGTVRVSLLPESVQLQDDLSLTLTVTNTTHGPIWYQGCGQVQESLVEGQWQAHGVITCYMEPEGALINPGTTFTTETPLYVREAGRYRLRVHLSNQAKQELREGAQLTNAVTITQ